MTKRRPDAVVLRYPFLAGRVQLPCHGACLAAEPPISRLCTRAGSTVQEAVNRFHTDGTPKVTHPGRAATRYVVTGEWLGLSSAVQNKRPPSGTLWSGANSTTSPSVSGKPSVSTSDINFPI